MGVLGQCQVPTLAGCTPAAAIPIASAAAFNLAACLSLQAFMSILLVICGLVLYNKVFRCSSQQTDDQHRMKNR